MIQQPSPQQPHQYGTRIRRNSVLKPSTRLRLPPSSPHPPPRRIKPVPIHAPHHPAPHPQDTSFPVFPIPGVMLHPEDASNKVFHAIGRSFLSVENRAMTIKDLAEMTLKYGLMCQNVSAASQAITTYIRNHMARCEAQQDHPLLVRHVLSGTPTDDELVPALHSRTGGATNPAKSGSKDTGAHDKIVQDAQRTPEERLTNFRRGTMVWYLSKAAGVACPFAHARIRLCEYGKEGRKVAERHGNEPHLVNDHLTRDEAHCGEKRKRLRRGCRRDSDGSQASSGAERDSHSPAIDSGYGDVSAISSDEERPPKVKLTLRLRPSIMSVPAAAATSRPREVIDLSSGATDSSSEDECVGADSGGDIDVDMCPEQAEAPWSLPPYPRRGISVPRYTPRCDEQTHSPWLSVQHHTATDERKRSPSVPWSASPPPDSDRDDFDLDLDSDIDWDSSSLSVPSPASALQVKVETADELQPFKHEYADIRDMLDAWEDFDCAPASTVSSATVKLPTIDDLKFDALELWEWEYESGWTGTPEDHQGVPVFKTEPDDHESPLAPDYPFSSTCSPFTSSSHHSSFSPVSESSMESFAHPSPLSFLAVSTSPSPPSFPIGTNRASCTLAWQDAELLGPDSVHPHEFEDGWACGARIHADCNLLPRHASGEEASQPCMDHKQDKVEIACAVVKEAGTGHDELKVHPSHPTSGVPDVVIVRTCHPCTPDVCATQIEGISVYQTKLGSALLLRRIDTDFVNLSTILTHLSLSPPSPLPDPCVHVSHPSLSISGIWAPLSIARLYAHGLPFGIESLFLSDDLVLRFPTALQDFYQRSTSWRMLHQFGPNFNVLLSSAGAENASPIPRLERGSSVSEDIWEAPMEPGLAEEPLLTIPPSVNLALARLHPSKPAEEASASSETPLSPTEQEMFHALCVHPDWETEEVGAASNGEKADAVPKPSPPKERPLRRSRRVADALAARARVVSSRAKGPRHP